MALEGMTSTAHSPAPSTTWNRSHLRHRDMILSPRPPRFQNYRAREHHSSPEGKLSYVIWGLPRTSTSWLRADTHSPAGYPCGRGGLLKSEGSIQGTRLPRKKEDVPFDPYPIRTSPISTKNKINPEDGCDLLLQLVTSTLCLSVTPLCLHLTSGQDQNKAAAPYNLIVDGDEIRVMSMCCCPQCGLGPDAPEGDLSCHVFRCPQYESPLIAREGNHLRPVGLLVVCAVPFSEVVPFCEKVTDVYPSLVSSRPSAVPRAIGDPPPKGGSTLYHRCERKIPRSKSQSAMRGRVEGRGPGEKVRPPLYNKVTGRGLLREDQSARCNRVDEEDPRQDKKVKSIRYSGTEGRGPH